MGVLLIAPGIAVLGASGAIFGLLGAFFVIQRRLGGNSVQLMVVIGLNLVAGFIIPGIAWQAHVGGLLIGGLVALVLVKTTAAATAKPSDSAAHRRVRGTRAPDRRGCRLAALAAVRLKVIHRPIHSGDSYSGVIAARPQRQRVVIKKPTKRMPNPTRMFH